jgi:hypothetical protein
MAGIGGRGEQGDQAIEIIPDVLPSVRKMHLLWTTRGRRQVKDDAGAHVGETVSQLPFRSQVEAMADNAVGKWPKPLLAGAGTDDNMNLMACPETGAGQMRANETAGSGDEDPRHRLRQNLPKHAAACDSCLPARRQSSLRTQLNG